MSFKKTYKKINEIHQTLSDLEKKGLVPKAGLYFLDPDTRRYDEWSRKKINNLLEELDDMDYMHLAVRLYHTLNPIIVRKTRKYLDGIVHI